MVIDVVVDCMFLRGIRQPEYKMKDKCKVLKCTKNISTDEFNGYCRSCFNGVKITSDYNEKIRKMENENN